MSDKSPQELLQSLSDEHEEVHKQISDLKQFWLEVSQLGRGPKYEEMGQRVRNLRELLAKHFASEEKGGYLAPAVAAVPQASQLVKQLEQDHAEFLRTLDSFIGRLAQCESAYDCWQEAHTEFEDFLRSLDRHETQEMAIVRQAIKSKEAS